MTSPATTLAAMAIDIIARRLRILIIRHHMRHYRRHMLIAQRHQEAGDNHLDRATTLATKFKT